MGKFSRQKGRRFEYEIRDRLRGLGYDAVRVPLSGASEGYKGDVIARKNGASTVYECKTRATSFESIYKFYLNCKQDDKVLRFVYEGVAVALSYDPDAIRAPLAYFPHFTAKDDVRAMKKILTMRQWLKGADILVIKNNNRHPIFIKYWG